MARSAIGNRCPRRDEFMHELDELVELTGGFHLADLFRSATGGLLECIVVVLGPLQSGPVLTYWGSRAKLKYGPLNINFMTIMFEVKNVRR